MLHWRFNAPMHQLDLVFFFLVLKLTYYSWTLDTPEATIRTELVWNALGSDVLALALTLLPDAGCDRDGPDVGHPARDGSTNWTSIGRGSVCRLTALSGWRPVVQMDW